MRRVTGCAVFVPIDGTEEDRERANTPRFEIDPETGAVTESASSP
jgi:hypothetical protein